MANRIWVFCFLFLLPLFSRAQEIFFSDPYRESGQEMNFDILGKINGKTVIFKNLRWKYAMNFFNDSMRLVNQKELDYLPGKTFNVDCIAYSDCIWLIYQYQKKGILYCMAQKLDANGEKVSEPMQLDTTQISSLGDNKIYSAIFSDDKKNIAVFKMQRKDDMANFLVKSYDKDLQLQRQSRFSIEYEDRKHTLGDFFVDNSGNFVFTGLYKKNSRGEEAELHIITKPLLSDTVKIKKLLFDSLYIDEAIMKIDNMNRRYAISALYYSGRGGHIEGIYNYVYDVQGDSAYAGAFTQFNDELRSIAKSSGSNKSAFNDFSLRNITLKRDGGFIVTAEEQTTQTTGNTFNRYNGLYGGSPYFNPYDYYYYSPSYYGYYRPFSSFGRQGIRYYNDNILVLSVSKTGMPEWTNVIHKQQADDDNDNYLSFSLFNTSGELHFLFNDITKRDRLLSDNIVTPGGNVKRNPTLRTYEKGFEFMPKFARQVSAREVIIPCTYRGQICFAKVNF